MEGRTEKMQMLRIASWLRPSTQIPLSSLSSATLIYKTYLLEENSNDIAQIFYIKDNSKEAWAAEDLLMALLADK